MSEFISQFQSYNVVDADIDLGEILDPIHTQYHHGLGPDTTKGPRSDKTISYEITELQWLCKELSSQPELVSVTGYEYAHWDSTNTQKIPLLIRHDVDGDIETALQMAKIEHALGLKGTFYILPAALYYSDYFRQTGGERIYRKKCINRYKNMIPLYKQIQDLGHEIGLHYYPYGVYRQMLMDGAQSIREETHWLRNQGLNIRGGVGHSSRSVQGGMQAEIFKEYMDPSINVDASNFDLNLRGPIHFDGATMPRHALSLQDVPIEYVLEFCRTHDTYFAIRDNGWCRCLTRNQTQRREDISSIPGLMNLLKRTVSNESVDHVCIMIHPVHMQARISDERQQEQMLRDTPPLTTNLLPESSAKIRDGQKMNVERFVADNETLMEVVNHTNIHGFIDYEPYPEEETHRRQIAILGGSLFDSSRTQVSQQVQGWLRKLYLIEDRMKISTRKYATIDADASFYEYALDLQLTERQPNVWILHLDNNVFSSVDSKGVERNNAIHLLKRLSKDGIPILPLIDDIDASASLGHKVLDLLREMEATLLEPISLASTQSINDNDGEARYSSVGFDTQDFLNLARSLKNLLSENIPAFYGTKQKVWNMQTSLKTVPMDQLVLSSSDVSALGNATHDEIKSLSDQGALKLASFLKHVDPGEHASLRLELEHVCKPQIYHGNFLNALGHAYRIPNLASSHGLDLGCSFGLRTVIMKQLGAGRITCCDAVPSLIEGATIWGNQTDIKDMQFIVNSSDGLPFDDNTFDWITCMSLYGNLNKRSIAGLFENCARVLKPGGLLLLNDSANPHHPPTAENILTHYRLVEIGEGTQEAPQGMCYEVRKKFIASKFSDLETTTLEELARNTCYMECDEIISVVELYLKTGTKPSSPFIDNNLQLVPVQPLTGNPCRTPTDPFVIEKELLDAGFSSVVFRTHTPTPGSGNNIQPHNLKKYFSEAPGVFLTASCGGEHHTAEQQYQSTNIQSVLKRTLPTKVKSVLKRFLHGAGRG